MADLSFEFDWIDPQGARGEELRATWARFSMHVNGMPVTHVLDKNSRTVRDSIFLPLYPLAEWITLNWWQLLYEIESPDRKVQGRYRLRHSLRSAREGFALPPVLIEPLGKSVRVSWEPEPFLHGPIEFVGGGREYVNADQFRESLTNLVEMVARRLDDIGIHNTVLQKEWAALREMDAEEKSFCKAAAAMGLEPLSLSEEFADQIIHAAELIPKELVDEFFSSADIETLLEEAKGVSEALDTVSRMDVEFAQLSQLRDSFAANLDYSHLPWDEGYRIARGLRQHLKLDSKPVSSFADLSSILRTTESHLLSAIPNTHTSIRNIDLILGYNSKGNPGFVIPNRTDEARRFAFCRGLFEFVVDHRPIASLVTKAGTEGQKRNRAFAAEFLLPSSALRQRVNTEIISEEEINVIASEYGVSWAVVHHQLTNHHIARSTAE